MRPARLALALLNLLALAACASPPQETYLPASTGNAALTGVSAGRDSRNEECLATPGRPPIADLPAGRSADIFCGGWTQPAAHVTELTGTAGPAQLDAIAAGGLWRSALERRFVCGAPQSATLSTGAPARLISCTRRVGGWPHLAVVAAGPHGPVVADGLVTTLPVIDRQITGSTSGSTAVARSETLALAVARLTQTAFSAADIGRYEQLMALGRELNQTENYVAAEDAYRGALAIQERLLGRDNPNTSTPLMLLALNLSNQGRRAQAQPLFVRAEQLAPRASDPLTPARLLHYRGLDTLNAGDPVGAARMLERAEQGYAAYVPAGPQQVDDAFGDVLVDPVAQSAVLGLAEARRNRGVALARAGQPAEGAKLADEARTILRDANLQPNLILGRGLRSAGSSSGALGRGDDAARLLDASARRFGQGAPGERPEAETLFLAGSRNQSAGRRSDALTAFRNGASILRARQIALSISLVLPYLDALWDEMARDPSSAQALATEMFGASQLAQRGQTSQLVAQASARLGTAGGNTKVAQSVRRLQDSDRELRALYAERDAAEASDSNEFDDRIAAGRTKRDAAESEVAAAAPGYRQLLLTAADAQAVAKVLKPKDALVSMLIGRDHGYTFAIRADGSVKAARIDAAESAIGDLVGRVRKGLDPDAANRAGSFDTRAAYAIEQLVLAPLGSALGGADTVLVAADGPLLSIPFGLLLTAPADPGALRDAPWLIRSYAIVHVPSAQTVVTLRSGAGVSPGSQPYAGFGAPIVPTSGQLAQMFPSDRCGADRALAAQLKPLPGTRAELEAARRLLGADTSAIHLGAAFTAAALQSAALGQDRIVHLATHALLPGELSCLREPTILVSPPPGARDPAAAFMPASELINLKLDADLVILSACNTGAAESGSGAGGEALSGLSRAFFFAGARGLLVTHWEVNDVAAALTVANTLERQQAGSGSAEALRGAQLHMLEQAGNALPASFANPFYWAPFALIGDGKGAGLRTAALTR